MLLSDAAGSPRRRSRKQIAPITSKYAFFCLLFWERDFFLFCPCPRARRMLFCGVPIFFYLASPGPVACHSATGPFFSILLPPPGPSHAPLPGSNALVMAALATTITRALALVETGRRSACGALPGICFHPCCTAAELLYNMDKKHCQSQYISHRRDLLALPMLVFTFSHTVQQPCYCTTW